MTLDQTSRSEAVARTWASLPTAERLHVFRSLPRGEADDCFLYLSTWDQAGILQDLTEGERRSLLRLLPLDDVADLIQQLREEIRAPYLSLIDEANRREVTALLAYKEDVAGGLMNPRFVRLRPDTSVDEALAYVRRQAAMAESIYYGYVLDSEQRLLGVVSFRDLFAAGPAQLVREIMQTNYLAANDQTDQEEVARLLTDHQLFAIPILDGGGRMQGIVTWDDIVAVVQEEASEDIQRFGGSEALEGPYLQVRFVEMVRKRAGWLAILFLGEMLTATAMGHFEEEIARAVVLVLFIPLIISSGGNSGSQAATLVIRAMALGEVGLKDSSRIIRRELAAGLVLGSVLGCMGMGRILIWQAVGSTYGEHYLLIGFTIAISLLGVVLFGTLAGSILPLVLQRLGFDPASASAPFVATLVDVTGLIIYFTIAAAVLRGSLL